MRIETLYNVGQEVWILTSGSRMLPQCETVNAILVHGDDDYVYRIFHLGASNPYAQEHELFPTEQAALDSIGNVYPAIGQEYWAYTGHCVKFYSAWINDNGVEKRIWENTMCEHDDVASRRVFFSEEAAQAGLKKAMDECHGETHAMLLAVGAVRE